MKLLYRIPAALLAASMVIGLLAACTDPSPNPGTEADSDVSTDTPTAPVTGDGTTAPALPTIPPETTVPTDTLPALPPDTPVEPNRPELPADAVDVTAAWGVRSGAGHALENSLALLSGVAAMTDGTTVYFPEGTYEVAFPIFIIGRQNIRIVGHKATLVRTGTVNTTPIQPPVETNALPADQLSLTSSTFFLYAAGTAGLAVEGLTFAYDTPTSLSGRVVSVDGGSAVVEITDGSPITGGEYATVINTFTEAGLPDRTLEQYAEANFPIEKVDDKTIRISGLAPGGASNLQTGTRVCIRLCTGREYVIMAQGTTDITFRDLTLRNSYNGGILLTERCGNVTLDGVRVQSDNPEALMSLNADALHIADMTGELTVRDCYFDRPGDDCINVHSGAYTVESASGKTATLSSPRFGHSSVWALPGDTLVFYDPATFKPVATATVAAVEGKSYTFEAALPAEVKKDCVVANEATRPTVTVQNTVAQNTRARGFLLQGGKTTVENCAIRGTALAAILVAPDAEHWYEMSPASELIIHGNTIENCGRFAAGAIQIAASHDQSEKTFPAYLHGTIRIEGNTFSGLRTPAVYALCVQNLTVTGNRIDETGYHGHLLKVNHIDDLTIDHTVHDRTDSTDVNNLTSTD